MASSPNYTVTFTVGLIEKLAGIKKAPAAPSKAKQQLGPPSQAAINPELLALKRQNAHLATALESSRQVGNLLLKNEEQELAKISQLTGELLKQYSYPPKPVPCSQEREACVGCYKENQHDPLKCADAVDAYSRCADKEFLRALRPQVS